MYLSTRRGSWILNRVGDSGKPGDMLFSRAAVQFLPLFRRFADGLFQWKLNQRFDHKKYCLQPDHGFFSAHPTVNDDLPNKIIAGWVKIKANIATLSDTSVKFEDGSEERDIDTVVLATGYVFGFPFLDKTVVDVKDNQVNLYKYIFPTHLKKNTLAIIGCFQPLGAIMPCSEQQCRLATRVFQVGIFFVIFPI